MEKTNSLSNDLKYHSIYTKRPMNLKESWDHHTTYNDHNDNFFSGFSWPPRSYTCTFCKREFRSAQALGGHMNVHRRDRARLRQSPPRDAQIYPGNNFLNLNLEPNPYPNPNPSPNPNFTSLSQPSSPQRLFNPSFTSKLTQLLSPSPSSLSSPSWVPSTEILEWGSIDHIGAPTHQVCPRSVNSGKMKSQNTLFDEFSGRNEFKVVKRGEISRLNLEIGLISESKVDDLDLELRLGYS